MSIVELTETDFSGKSMNNKNFTGYVGFLADWCGHCNNLKPIWQELANQSSKYGFKVARVDCTQGKQNLLEHFGVKGFPSVHYFVKGVHQGEYSGPRELDAYITFAKHNMGAEAPKDSDKPNHTPTGKGLLNWKVLVGFIVLSVIAIIIGYLVSYYKGKI